MEKALWNWTILKLVLCVPYGNWYSLEALQLAIFRDKLNMDNSTGLVVGASCLDFSFRYVGSSVLLTC